QGLGELQSAGRREGGVPAETVSSRERGRRPAEGAPGTVGGIARRHHRRLRIHRLVQRLRRTFVQEREKLIAERVARLGAHLVDRREPGIALQHADGLRSLPRKNHRELYSVTSDEPHVNPPPTPCRSTRCPARIFPARMYSSSASGTDAA